MLPFAKRPLRLRLIMWWCKHLLSAFNIRVRVIGDIPSGNIPPSNTMLVANHISWADIHALNSVVPLRFIAKAEIKAWPIFGYLSTKANALYIDRTKRHDAARIVEATAQSLASGDNLCLFPEGTTTDGSELKPFKSSLIQAAIHANAIIWPVAIRYPRPDGTNNIELAYTGETTLKESMQHALNQKHPVVELHFLTPINTQDLADKDRRTLTLHIQNLIRTNLGI